MTVKIIAEAGVNWDTIDDLLAPSAVQYIVNAKGAGADYIKFQLFNEETVKDSPLKERLKNYILTEYDVEYLKQEADRVGIGFILTPMYPEAVSIASKYADIIKIRFKDRENKELIELSETTGKQLLVSVPRRPINQFSAHMKWLYCIPSYPPNPQEFNLDYATVCDGFSSHFPHTLFDLAFAINRTYDDVFIEKHVMEWPSLTKSPEPIDKNVSITFGELESFISQLKLIDAIQRVRI